MTTESLPGRQLLQEILRRRNDSGFRKQRAELRRGADDTTEYYAIPYVYPALPAGTREHEYRVLLRMAAIAAEFTDVPSFERTKELRRKPFGRWCQQVSWAKKKSRSSRETSEVSSASTAETLASSSPTHDAIAERLAYLHTQDFEEAVKTIRRIFQIAESVDAVPALDYLDLYRLLLHWGKGASAQSRAMRMSPLRDYYSNFVPRTDQIIDAADHSEDSDKGE